MMLTGHRARERAAGRQGHGGIPPRLQWAPRHAGRAFGRTRRIPLADRPILSTDRDGSVMFCYGSRHLDPRLSVPP